MATKTFTLYLLKDRISDFHQSLSETAQSRLRVGDVVLSRSGELGQASVVYVFQNPITEPRWLSDIRSVFSLTERVNTQSASSIIFFRASGRAFAVTFGSAWLFLDPASIVNDFGLRVALNASNDDLLRRLDTSNLGEAMKGISQSASQRKFETFGVDEALELVRKINGKARNSDFGSTITGSSSLKVSKEMELVDLPALASEALQYYASTAYRSTSFRIIDNIMPVTDSDLAHQLDQSLVQAIISNSSEFELGLPEISDDDIVSFRFTGFNGRTSYQDLQLRHYRESLAQNLQNLSVATLHLHLITATYGDIQKPQRNLRVYDALIGSTTLDDERYAINEGAWYQVESQFRNSVQQSFSDHIESFPEPPPVVTTIISADRRKRQFESEESYNTRYASEKGLILMDRRLIDIPDIQRSQFEVCDLIDIEGKRLIHVKMSGRRSSILSHLFKQGKNSARLLRSIDSAWTCVVERIRSDFGQTVSDRLLTALADRERPWRVEFHIVDHPLPTGEFTIPFFSRVTFRDEARDIRSMGYEVAIKFIPKPNIQL